jgi:N6-adenosine-specific RNA methylase IME4
MDFEELSENQLARLKEFAKSLKEEEDESDCQLNYFGLPSHKQFDVIYADPPWEYPGSTIKGVEAHYDPLSISAIGKLPVEELAAKDCALLLWTTGPHLSNALTVMKNWGFKYKTMFFVWVKLNKKDNEVISNGAGWYTKPQTEFVLLGTKGHVLKHRRSCKVKQTIFAPRREHSRKPTEAYEMIEEYFGKDLNRIELFARNERAGWTSWGTEKTKFNHQ